MGKLVSVVAEILLATLGTLMILKGNVAFGAVVCGGVLIPEITVFLLLIQNKRRSYQEISDGIEDGIEGKNNQSSESAIEREEAKSQANHADEEVDHTSEEKVDSIYTKMELLATTFEKKSSVEGVPLPKDIWYQILSLLDLKSIHSCSLVCKTLAAYVHDPWLVKEILKRPEIIPSMSIIGQEAWESKVDMKKYGLSFDSGFSLFAEIEIVDLFRFSSLSIQNSAGFTLLALPTGLSIETLEALVKLARENGRQALFLYTQFSQEQKNNKTDKSYAALISNDILCESERYIPEIFANRFDCEMLDVFDTITLIILNYMMTQKILYSDTYTYTKCSSKIFGANCDFQIVGGCKWGRRLNVYTRREFISNHGVAVMRKFSTESISKRIQAKILKIILSNRSESWSEKSPFGVFYIKDVGSLIQGGYEKKVVQYTGGPILTHRLGCHGYFSTQEKANQAKLFLEKSKGYRDAVWVEQIANKQVLSQIERNGYKSVNGFDDTNWWKAETHPFFWGYDYPSRRW